MPAETADLTRKDYDLIRELVYTNSGINLGDQKMQLVRSRLGKMVRQGGFGSFREYYNHVERDSSGEELGRLLDAISTNTTHLFREIKHFNLLRDIVVQWTQDKTWKSNNRVLRIWCAASSSGEEPHSIAMVVHDALRSHPEIEPKILASDISTQMLAKAKRALYEPHRLGTVPAQFKNRYFKKVTHDGKALVQLVPELRRLITFTRFNLMKPSFPFRFGFHIIFCRNVMIYFDKPTQETLVNKFAGQLHRGGYLLIGHSESLNNLEHPLTYSEPTVYRKP